MATTIKERLDKLALLEKEEDEREREKEALRAVKNRLGNNPTVEILDANRIGVTIYGDKQYYLVLRHNEALILIFLLKQLKLEEILPGNLRKELVNSGIIEK